MRTPSPAELVRLGAAGDERRADRLSPSESFEKARATQGGAFAHDLELGVLYLAARRFAEARDALDRVPPSHPAYPMALFKRAQVSVLLNEPDQAARIERARERADATTRPLIARERLFQGAAGPLRTKKGPAGSRRALVRLRPRQAQNCSRAASWKRRGS